MKREIKKIRFSLLTALLLFSLGASAQMISGRVTNEQGEPLVGANVYWLGSNIGVQTKPNGQFQISTEGISDMHLIASYVGHIPDTFEITGPIFLVFNLKSSQALDEVVVSGQRDGVIISDLSPIKTEQITQTELEKPLAAIWQDVLKHKPLCNRKLPM